MGFFYRKLRQFCFIQKWMKQDKCTSQEETAAHFDVSIQNQSPNTTLEK